jgi:hypothetical protein
LLVYVVVRQVVRLYNPNGRKKVDRTLPPTVAPPEKEMAG